MATRPHALRPLSYRILAGIMLLIASFILVYEIAVLLPAFNTTILADYKNYFLPWGRDARAGILNYRYPLPTLLWIFVPLSLMPSWFSVVWFVMPFVFVFLRFRKQAPLLWLSHPFLLQGLLGQLDGWLLFPLWWLFEDHPAFAGLSAALISLKPQLALFPVPYMVYHWIAKRNWTSLLSFCGAITLLYVPAFIVDPLWPLKMIPEGQVRATEPIQASRGISLWNWWESDSWSRWALPAVIVVVAFLLVRVWRSEQQQPRAMHLLGLVCIPVFYSVSLVTVIPTLDKSTRHLIAFVAVSWVSYGIDAVLGGWGGAYVLVPMTALWLMRRDPSPGSGAAPSPPPFPSEPSAHA